MATGEENNVYDFCLLIPCYNNSAGLKRSLASVHYNTNNYCVVIVDDGSTGAVKMAELRQPGMQAPPIHIIRLQNNKGITPALNAGLEWIITNTNARYIARIDCGDICNAERFIKQAAFLDAHPGVGLLGTWCFFKSEDRTQLFSYQTPLVDNDIRREMHLRNVFIHPTVMFRTDLVKKVGLYSEQYPYAEDYALFWSMLQEAEGAILGQCLVTCVLTSGGLSASNRHLQLKSCKRIVSSFGTIPFWKFWGTINTSLRMLLPQKLILKIKIFKQHYRINIK